MFGRPVIAGIVGVAVGLHGMHGTTGVAVCTMPGNVRGALVAVGVAVGRGVLVDVGDATNVLVAVGVSVDFGVDVFVGVGVYVLVAVNVAVGVDVLVAVGVAVAVDVSVGVGVDGGHEWFSSTKKSISCPGRKPSSAKWPLVPCLSTDTSTHGLVLLCVR